MNKISKLLLAALVLLWLPLTTLGGINTWTGTTPLATGQGNKIINALAVTPDGLTVFAGNGSGTVLSYDIVPPSVTTSAAGSVTAVSAILNGTVNANNGGSNSTLFRYGTATGVYGSTVAATPSSVTGSSTTDISASLSGLVPNTTYYFRAEATGVGTVQGSELWFVTSKLAPTAVSAAATNLTGTTATLNGTVNAQHDSTAISFEYGLTTSYGSTVTLSSISTYADTAVSTSLSGLVPNTTYYFRVKAVNSMGTAYGSQRTFTTPVVAPVVTTGSASSLTTSSATLNGTVNANNASTAVTFEYGASTSYGSTATASPSPVTGVAITSVSAALTGLTANTTYHFRVVGGSSNGSDQTFTTLLATPVAAAASAVTLTGFTANWAAVTGATGYQLDVATDSGFTSLVTGYSSLAVGNVTSQAVTGLTAGSPYWYRVRAINDSNHSDNSNPITITTGSSRVVTNTNDSGAGSLRQVIADAVAGDSISFASAVRGSITLASTLTIDKDLSIIGPGAALLTISGNNAVQIFNVTGAGNFTLQSLSLANGLSSSGGGAVQAVGAISTNISGCVFSGNTSTGNGGAILTANGVMNISDSLFSGNSATSPSSGGALAATSGTLNISNSTLTGNSAEVGGAIFGQVATTTLTNLTVSNNSASQGGGVSIAGGSTVTLKNTLIANNTATGSAPDLSGTVTSQGYNLIGSPSGVAAGITNGVNNDIVGTVSVPINPLLGSLANNGGPTQTLALLSGSPALDAIPNGTNGCGSTLVADQRGMVRPQNGSCDIGAYERGVPASLAATAGTPQSALINTAFATPLAVKVSDALDAPLDGISVTFTGPVSGAGIATGSVSSNGSGIASFAATANGSAGSNYTVTASVGSVTNDTFRLSNTLPSYTITATASPTAGGTVSCWPNPVDHGGNSTCTATASTGYSFTSWTGACTSQGATCNLSSITANRSSTAAFAQNSYTGSSPTGTGVITATLTGGGVACGFINPQFIPLTGHAASPPAGSAPAGISFPHGLFDFTTGGCAPGSTITLTISYPQALPTGTAYWKYGPTPTDGSYHWYQLPATIGGNIATFSITDGGLGDDDLTANGTIVDQGGPGYGGGAVAITTLGEWAMLALIGLLGILGMNAARRRTKMDPGFKTKI